MKKIGFGVLGFLIVIFALASVGDEVVETEPIQQTAASGVEGFTSPLEGEVETNSPDEVFKVVKVVDGDTLTVEKDGKQITLRLIGLDTPETVDPRTTVECFGVEASLKAKEVLSGEKVRIEKDPSQGELDKYKRTLAYVFLEDGTNFNKLMIEEGYGYEYTYNAAYKYQKEFRAAQKEAEVGKRGLWAEGSCEQKTEQAKPVPVSVPDGKYVCSKNTYNCTSFKSQQEAQEAFDACGGSGNDIHKLDSDKDGVVCESLP